MKLYADSADLGAVLPLLHDGLLHGVTTNPSVLARAGLGQHDLPVLVSALVAAGAPEVFVQAVGGTREGLQRSADELAGLGDQVVLKVPATDAGFRVARRLVRDGVRVLVTALYTPAQAAVAASVGAQWVAPYYGRMVDAGHDGLAAVTAVDRVLAGTGTRVLVASVRSAAAAGELALAGLGHLTADVPVLLAMMTDPASDAAAAEFDRVSERMRQENHIPPSTTSD